MKYRKRPIVIDAVQWNGENLGAISILISNADLYEKEINSSNLKISTLEGIMIAAKGDYIIKGIKGEFYPCKPDIFEATYEAVEEYNFS